jgi:hypothetical protein
MRRAFWSALVGAFALAGCEGPAEPLAPEVNQPPVPVLVLPDVIRAGEPFEADGRESFDVDGEVLEAVLRFGDGSDPELFLVSTHTFSEPGRYVVELYIADDEGARARARRVVLVQ